MGNPMWDFAGFTGPESLLGRYIQDGMILVPRISKPFEAGFYWEVTAESKWIDAPKGLIDKFIALRDKDNEAIVTFAKQYGILWPYTRKAWRRGIEKFDDWRDASRRAWAIVEMATFVQAGKPVPAAVLDVLCKDEGVGHMEVRVLDADLSIPVWRYGDGRTPDFPRYRRPTAQDEIAAWIEHGVQIVAAEISEWMQVGGVSLALTVNEGTWDLRVSFQGRLIGALALQLALAVSRSDVPFTCSECGKVYIRGRDEGQSRRRRRPNPGWRNFCPECGRKAAVRAADERRRRNVAEARRLHREEKLSYEAIAEKLGKDLPLVKRWIEKGK